jgi:hypothetical protein
MVGYTYLELFARRLTQIKGLYKFGSVKKDWRLVVGDSGHGKVVGLGLGVVGLALVEFPGRV